MDFGMYCGECQITWPNLWDFRYCPQCEQKTRYATGEPLDQVEAARLQLRAQFRVYYAERECHREGPTPEQVGVEEALEEMRVIRELMEALDLTPVLE